MKISGREVQKAVVSGGARLPSKFQSALTSLKLCTNHRCKTNAKDYLVSPPRVSQKGVQTLSRVLVHNGLSYFSFKSRRMAKPAQREVVDFQIKIKPPLNRL